MTFELDDKMALWEKVLADKADKLSLIPQTLLVVGENSHTHTHTHTHKLSSDLHTHCGIHPTHIHENR